jgi:hypothetical protein
MFTKFWCPTHMIYELMVCFNFDPGTMGIRYGFDKIRLKPINPLGTRFISLTNSRIQNPSKTRLLTHQIMERGYPLPSCTVSKCSNNSWMYIKIPSISEEIHLITETRWGAPYPKLFFEKTAAAFSIHILHEKLNPSLKAIWKLQTGRCSEDNACTYLG